MAERTIDGQMDGWTDGRINGLILRVNGLMQCVRGKKGERREGLSSNRWMDGWMNGLLDEQI